MTVTAGGASEPRWLPAGGPLLPVVATDGRRRAWAVDRGGRILVAVDLLGVPGSLERSLPADLDLRRVRALLFHPTAGLLWAADVGRHRLLLLRAGASVALVRSVGGRGRGPGEFNYPVDLALAPDGDVWVLDALNHRLQRFGPGGDLRNALPPDPEALVRPTALVIDPAGRPWVFEASRGVLLGYDTDGRPLLDAEGHRVRIDAGPGCSDMATTPDGRLWLADPLSGLVRVFEWVDGSGDGVSSRGSAS